MFWGNGMRNQPQVLRLSRELFPKAPRKYAYLSSSISLRYSLWFSISKRFSSSSGRLRVANSVGQATGKFSFLSEFLRQLAYLWRSGPLDWYPAGHGAKRRISMPSRTTNVTPSRSLYAPVTIPIENAVRRSIIFSRLQDLVGLGPQEFHLAV